MNKRNFIFLSSALLSSFVLAPVTAYSDDTAKHDTQNKLLDKFHGNIRNNFSAVEHLTPSQIDALDADTILFDVREKGEFAVSHIEGAVRVDPSLNAEDFMTRLSVIGRVKRSCFIARSGSALP